MSQREGESSGTLLQHSVVVALAVIVLVHSLLIALWLAPPGPLRTGTGPGFVSRYVDPYFKQSWTSLDPSSQRVDERLRIRARVRDASGSDELIETPWVDVTATDVEAVHLDISPARVRLIARRLATNVNATYLDLDLTSAGPGHFTTNAATIPFAGTWEFTASIRRGEFDEERARFSVSVSPRSNQE